MALPDIFLSKTNDLLIARLEQLNKDSQPLWGKMSVGKMLGHCNVTYEMVFEEAKHPKAKGFMKMMMKWMVKPIVTNEKEYKKNSRTAPQFLITEDKDFTQEKERLVAYIRKVQGLGSSHFDGKDSHSFGPLNTTEWNNMFYKHLDHHLRQFGV